VASDAAVEAERAWVAALPFRFDQYFDVLGAKPEAECRLHLELWWAGQGVDGHTLQGIVALFDTQSVVVQPQGGHAAFKTGPISGMTGIRINRHNVYRNHRLGKALHRLVEVVLLPLHRGAPLAHVTLSRSL
jgi:hypothetical protein